MEQSGSTLLYNLIRYAYIHSDGYKVYGVVEDQYDPLSPKAQESNIHIRKGHEYRKRLIKWADLIFVTKRDIRDCIASRRRKRDIPSPGLYTTRWCLHLISAYEKWMKHANFEFCYEKYKNNSAQEAQRILDVLNISDVNPNELVEFDHYLLRMSGRKLDKIGFQNILMKRNIITNKGKIGAYKDLLSQKEIIKINKKFGGWLSQHGYL